MNFKELQKVYLIAEIGVNHGGCVQNAIKMIDAAKLSGANAVKFQTFTAQSLVTLETPKVKYQESSTPSNEDHYSMIKNLELSKEDHLKIFNHCNSIDIDFISTPYDLDSAKFLNEIGVSIFKVASADIVDLPLHEYLASLNKPVIIATGMSTLGEIDEVVKIYRKHKSLNICLLHCVSNYPCSNESLNLSAISTIALTFQLPVGFSDHSVGNIAACLSTALGVKVIEKHFTTDKDLPGPDHKASSTPEEFYSLVSMVRLSQIIMGNLHKNPQDEEIQMAMVSRKSIVANSNLPKGHIITKKDLTLKRPGTGLYSKYLSQIIGKRTLKAIPENKLITWHDIEED
jgi:sialic acid synthase SpsE